MSRQHKCGLYIGRFQPIHIGHEVIIRQMLDECDTVIIAIGSSQESKTQRNPFSYEQRADFITNIFYQYVISGRMLIVPLRDRLSVSNDASWGDYVFQNIWDYTHRVADVIYEGQENERNHWYDNLDVEVIKVPRGIIPVSATLVRKVFESTLPSYEAFTLLPKAIHYRIPEMREVIRNANKNR